MTAQAHPHDAATVTVAVRSLPQPISIRAAALHLALPKGVVPGIAVRIEDGMARYRGRHVELTNDPITDACTLAAAGHRNDDEYLDLGADPTTWIKVVRSGTRRIAFGTDTLFGVPVLAIGDRVPDSAAHELVATWRNQERIEDLVHLAAGTYQVAGTAAGYVLQEAVIPRQMTKAAVLGTDVTRSANGVAAELAGTLSGVEVVETAGRGAEVDVTVNLGNDWNAVVPVHVTASSEMVGIDDADVARSAAEVLPDGWSWQGRTESGSIVGQHRASMVTALLARN